MNPNLNIPKITLVLSVIAVALMVSSIVATSAPSGRTVDASDATPTDTPTPTPTPTRSPSPVNPPGPIPALLSDAAGNQYEVFTPEEGGSFMADGATIVARPGDVPSALIVGVNVCVRDEASNVGRIDHRYTLGGNYYAVDSVDENGEVPSPAFRFRSPPVVCLPMPNEFLGNIDEVALIATDDTGSTQTVLNSRASIQSDGLKVCGYLGAVPAVLAVGRKGSPGPLPPPPTVEPEALPATGASALDSRSVLVLLLIGAAAIGVGVVAFRRSARFDS